MDRVQCVGIGSALSDFVLNVVSGVPQGSVLGHVPVLFIISINNRLVRYSKIVC